MTADYISSGRRWSGPRLGINWAGCIAWIVRFLVVIPEHIPGIRSMGQSKLSFRAVLFCGWLIVYFALAKAGMRSPVLATSTQAV